MEQVMQVLPNMDKLVQMIPFEIREWTGRLLDIIKIPFVLPMQYPAASMPLYLAGLCSIGGYVATVLLQNLVLDLVPVNLKKKYGAQWALVTGASSGVDSAA